MAILKDLIVHGSSRFLNKIYASELETPLIEAEAGIFKKLKADSTTVVGLLDVKGQLHTNSWSNSNIATIDGSFYITPTIGSASGTVTITASSLVFSGTNYAVSSLYLGDGSSITWPQYSKVLVTGQILSNGEWIPLGTLLGQLSAPAAAASIKIKNIKDNKNQTSSVLTTLVNNGTTSSDYRNLKVSLYQRASSSTAFYPLGIYMTATGTNGRTFLDIYGGVEALSNSNNYGGFAEPNVRIGNLQGLPNVGGQTPSGWGIYTDNGYFKGVIAADQGYIGSSSRYWVIANYEDDSNPNNSRSYIYSYNGTDNGTNSITSTVEGIYLGTDGIRNYKDSTHYVTITNGVISALGVNLSGKITATSGTIGGASITNGTLIVGNANISDINASKINAGDIAAARIQTNLISAIDAKVNDLSALTATIGGFQIDSSSVHTKSVTITSNADNSIALSSSDFTRIINSTSRTGLRFAIGDKFGVTGDGTVYASNVDLTGKITATSGTIGGIEIENGALKVSSINIGNLGGASNYAQKTYVIQAIDDIEVGGRNIIWNSNFHLPVKGTWNDWGSPTTREIVTIDGENWMHIVTTANAYQGYSQNQANRNGFGEIQAGEQIIFSFDAYSKVDGQEGCIGIHWRNSNNITINQNWASFNLTTTKKRYVTNAFTVPDNAVGFNIMVGQRIATAQELWITNIKGEKGNKATAWTPAPEDVEADIEDAKKIATNYITQIDNTGIKITPYDKSGNDYLQINSDAISTYRANEETLRIEDDNIRIGNVNQQHLFLKANGVYMKNKNVNSLIIRKNELSFSFGNGVSPFLVKQYGILETKTGNGSTTSFESSSTYVIEENGLLSVTLDGVLLEEDTDYTYSINNNRCTTVFKEAPANGSTIEFSYSVTQYRDVFEKTIEDSDDPMAKRAIELPETCLEILKVQIKENNSNSYQEIASDDTNYGYVINPNASFMFTFNQPLEIGTEVRVTYRTGAGSEGFYYNLGIRANGGTPGPYSVITGTRCVASGKGSFAGGMNTWVSGENSFGYGYGTGDGDQVYVKGNYSGAIGRGLRVTGHDCFAVGKYNIPNTAVAFAVGNGESLTNRSNAFWVGRSGNVGFGGSLFSGTSPLSADRIKLFARKTRTGSCTVGAGTTNDFTIALNKDANGNLDMEGYTPWAIYGLYSSSASCNVYRWYMNGNNFVGRIYNPGTSSITVNLTIYVSYIATSAL